MRALAVLGIFAATVAAEPMKPVVASFAGVTRVLGHARLLTRGSQQVIIVTEAVMGCDDQKIPPQVDYSIIVALHDRDVRFVAFKTKTGIASGRGRVDVVPTRDRASIGTLEVAGANVEAHGAFDLVVCPPDNR